MIAVGIALAILGYAVVYSGVMTLRIGSDPNAPRVGVLDSLNPGVMTTEHVRHLNTWAGPANVTVDETVPTKAPNRGLVPPAPAGRGISA